MSNDQSQFERVFFIDVDNTLIDNDGVKIGVDTQMKEVIGEQRTERFWEVYEVVRKDKDGVDIPETLRRVLPEYEDKALYRKLYRLWMDFSYPKYIFPGVFEVINYLKTLGLPVILSDGDAEFQLRKIVKSGLCRAVDGNVLIYQHKDHHFEDISITFPAKHYIMIEDKPNLLALAKQYFDGDITTILVKQGKYANQTHDYQPDIVVPAIAELTKLSEAQFDVARHQLQS